MLKKQIENLNMKEMKNERIEMNPASGSSLKNSVSEKPLLHMVWLNAVKLMHTLIIADMPQDIVYFSLSAKQQTHLHIIFVPYAVWFSA